MFTPDEKIELVKLFDAGKAIRIGLRNIETNISDFTGSDTRDLLYEADHVLTEVEEGIGNGTMFLMGSSAERDDVVRDTVRNGPRSGYIDRAYEQFKEANREAPEGFEVLNELALVRPDDLVFQLQIQRVKFQLTTAINKLTSFSRNLDWNKSTPNPATILFQDQMWQARQYSYDVAELATGSYGLGPILDKPLYRKYNEVLSRIWLFTDELMRSVATVGGVDNKTLDSVLLDLQKDAPQYLHVVQVGLAQLIPFFQGNWARVLIKNSDAWRHLDFGAREVVELL